ncbi:MAG: ABC transporter permease, partial [Acidobacteriota bacterium]
GVAVGIVAYTFIAALINGLAVSLTNDVIGNLPHVVLEPPARTPRIFLDAAEAPGRVLPAVQQADVRRPEIDSWRLRVAQIDAQPEVIAVSPQATGSGFVQRGARTLPIGIVGLEPTRLSAIIDFGGNLVRGDARLGPGDVLIGVVLADELGITTGQRLRLRSERQRERTVRVRGIFDVGSASANERLAVVDLRTGQSLLALGGTVSRIELKVRDVDRAPRVARRLAAATGLDATDWIADNPRLQGALRAQGTTGDMIKVFSLLTILIGVASVLLLAAVRRRAEIGILRSMGASRGAIRRIFQLQGLLLGAGGASLGAAGGWLFCRLLQELTRGPDGQAALPVDPAQGEYLRAIAFATLAGVVAAILPARAAARVDPVDAIQQ